MNENQIAPVPPRAFTAPSLDQDDLIIITTLTKQLAESSYLRDSHVQLIQLLHKGFRSHVIPPDDSDQIRKPHDYPLLQELRQAREAMDARFQVGEELWIQWLQDECMIAQTTEDRIAVIELCKKAVEEEAGSSLIWRFYGDWMWILYKIAHDIDEVYEDCSLETDPVLSQVVTSQTWTEEDTIAGPEIFQWQPMIEVWKQGVQATQWHIDSSHAVWDPYLDLQVYNHDANKSEENFRHVWRSFSDRLKQPHLTWDDTLQAFSRFVSMNCDNNEQYEQVIVDEKKKASKGIYEKDLRQERELNLQQAAENGDTTTEWSLMAEYLEWESAQHKKKSAPPFSHDMFAALCERANLKFPAEVDFWEAHIELMMEKPRTREILLGVADRATRHCPWSGELWARRLYCMEAAKKPFDDLETVKHLATSTGLLEEVGNMEELIKVHLAWCGYLRRQAFAPSSSEDERDVAHVAIRSAIEDVKKIGEKKFGPGFKGDPLFRIEKIYLKFLTQAGNFEACREWWHKLMLSHGDSYEFWNVYYLWEMNIWGVERGRAEATGAAFPSPERATGLLQRAIRRPNLDWPEKLIDAYIHHCAQHESIDRFQEANTEARRASKQVAKRRAKEMAEAATVQQQNPTHHSATVTSEPMAEVASETNKRRHESDHSTNDENDHKRLKVSEGDTNVGSPTAASSSSATAQAKRDREHTTVVVKHLPADITEFKVRKFFQDCGDILSLSLVAPDDGTEASATIEFESAEDVLTAQTKGMKVFEGRQIDVQVGTGTTLWVTNYPPEADENYIRQLFKPYGDIVEVRFPSLKYSTHRRFCYVQFLTSSQAQAATALDGKALGGRLVLSAKISDPSVRKDRKGAVHEGREVYVSNVEWSASEADIKAAFGKFGSVENVRIPRNMVGKSKGTAFVVFSNKEEAQSALEMNLKDFRGRVLTVELAVPNAKGAKTRSTAIVDNENKSRSRLTSHDSSQDPDHPMTGTSPGPDAEVPATNTKMSPPSARTVALLNLPDTVNDSRVRALVEPHASVKMISLRPDHQGAIVELEREADVGKVHMAIEGTEIQGKKISVGKVSELMRMKPAVKANGVENKESEKSASSKSLMTGPPFKRPRAGKTAGPKRGGRGGLGFQRSGRSTGSPNDEVPGGKSQNDFRKMLESGAKESN